LRCLEWLLASSLMIDPQEHNILLYINIVLKLVFNLPSSTTANVKGG